ncbi:hypothetical protein [Nioella aestuarii]|uniref:hypothetical protein n=1 Tax=Nioella aestuarii TaxID=1662864 RepID=UPI003D7F643C
MTRTLAAALMPLLLTACAEPVPEDDGLPGLPVEITEEIIALVDPSQSLASVRILPEDGCYWYRYSGPVETTYLPLRTAEGRRICSERAAEIAATAEAERLAAEAAAADAESAGLGT